MRRAQQGFTLIEIVIAFSILALATVLVVNLVTQSSVRADRVDAHFAAMDTLETAVAVVRGELALRQTRESYYKGTQPDGYRWEAQVLGTANTATNNTRRYLNLYRVRLQVFDDSDHPRLELVTIVADR
jgi:prepilin-type N-terminal cleavage/methylation domain-containing protein